MRSHRRVPDDILQLVEEQLAPGVDPDVVAVEVPVVLARQAGRLTQAIEVEPGKERLVVPVASCTLPAVSCAVALVEERGLVAGEALVQPALAPLVVGQDAHQVVVAQLVHDETLTGRAVVDHHRELGAAALDPVHVGDLRPGELAEDVIEPLERDGRPLVATPRPHEAVSPGW